MKVLVVGSLTNVDRYRDLCESFVRTIGERIVDRGHVVLTGCRGSLDLAIAKAAHQFCEKRGLDSRGMLVSYRLKSDAPAHRLGCVHVSARSDWDLTHPDLDPPEQFAEADVTICVAGSQGTFIAANWARIAGKPTLGVAQFGGAGEAICLKERSRFGERYARAVSKEQFDVLRQDTLDMDQLAADVVSLSEQIVTPKSVFVIMPFAADYRDVLASYRAVCAELGFHAERTDESETTERIVPRIFDGIRHSAFVIADATAPSPNVFYEIGYAQGLGKPVILTAKKGTDLPFDLADLPTVFWDGQEDLKERLRRRIKHAASRIGSQARGDEADDD